MIRPKSKLNQAKEKRIRKLLTLARRNDDAPGQCPDPNEMATFLQGTIETTKGLAIEAHLKSCSECREDCLLLPDNAAANGFPTFRENGWLARTARRISSRVQTFGFPKPLLTLSGAAALVVIAVLIWVQLQPDIADLMNHSYAPNVLADISAGLMPIEHRRKFAWEEAASPLGFTPAQRPNINAALAFGAGLWTGRRDLTGDREQTPPPSLKIQKWLQTQWRVDYWMGRWCYLTRAAAASDHYPAYGFWQAQLRILTRFQKQWKSTHSENEDMLYTVARHLEKIGTILGSAEPGGLSREDRLQISTELDFLIELMSPDETTLTKP